MIRKMFVAAIACGLLVAGFGLLRAQQSSNQPSAAHSMAMNPATGDVPAFHATPPRAPLPATLDPKQFSDPMVQNAYALASKVKPVLYQQPCYCHCDNEVGHKSLLDCFTGNHASVCSVCMKEAVYTYQQTHAGKSPAQIRAGIIAGKWKDVDMEGTSRNN